MMIGSSVVTANITITEKIDRKGFYKSNRQFEIGVTYLVPCKYIRIDELKEHKCSLLDRYKYVV